MTQSVLYHEPMSVKFIPVRTETLHRAIQYLLYFEVCVCDHEDKMRSPWIWRYRHCELPDTDAGNHTWVL